MDKKKLTKEEKEEIKKEKQKKERFDEEIDSYRKTSFFEKIPFMVKALLLKWWFYGAIFFFILMGLGTVVSNTIDRALICGLVGGLLLDLVYGNLCLLMDDEEEKTNWVMIYKSKKIWSTLINIAFGLAVFFLTAYTCSAIISLYPGEKTFWLFQEPISMAIISLAYDEIIVLIKQGIIKLIDNIKLKRIKKKKEGK